MFGNNKHKRQLFERTILPHLDAAYNLARWLTNNASDADDVVQEAYLKAFKAFDTYNDQNSRAWILAIIRNTAYTWLIKHNKYNKLIDIDEISGVDEGQVSEQYKSTSFLDPSQWLSIQADITRLYRVLDQLPLNFKEIVILREIEGCDYRELSEILNIAPGTVMSRLSRARISLQQALLVESTREHQEQESSEL